MSKKICKKCGCVVNNNDMKYCPECGSELSIAAIDNSSDYQSDVLNRLGDLAYMTAELKSQVTEIASNQCKSSESYDASTGNNSAESILTAVAYIILLLGIFASVICGIIVLTMGNRFGVNATLLSALIAIVGSFASVLSWAMFMISINISTNIRHIKHLLTLNTNADVTL